MQGIFLSYRREDTSGHADRIYDHLVAHFGKDRVFMDIDTISPGDDFVEAIEHTFSSCAAFLVLIGKSWATVTDKQGRRRLDNPNDFVRMEVARGLATGVRVIPLLLDDAEMPDPEVLPEDLKKLAFRQALAMSRGQRFQNDMRLLIEVVDRALEKTPRGAGGLAGKHGSQAQTLARRVDSQSSLDSPGSNAVLGQSGPTRTPIARGSSERQSSADADTVRLKIDKTNKPDKFAMPNSVREWMSERARAVKRLKAKWPERPSKLWPGDRGPKKD
jgi:TIR domain